MTTLMWIYIGLYSLVWVVLVVDDSFLTPAEERDPLWESVADYLLLGIGLAGMLLYQLQIRAPALEVAWKIVAPLLLVAHLVLNLRGRRKVMEKENLAAITVRWTDLATLAFLGPSLGINLVYAFG